MTRRYWAATLAALGLIGGTAGPGRGQPPVPSSGDPVFVPAPVRPGPLPPPSQLPVPPAEAPAPGAGAPIGPQLFVPPTGPVQKGAAVPAAPPAPLPPLPPIPPPPVPAVVLPPPPVAGVSGPLPGGPVVVADAGPVLVSPVSESTTPAPDAAMPGMPVGRPLGTPVPAPAVVLPPPTPVAVTLPPSKAGAVPAAPTAPVARYPAYLSPLPAAQPMGFAQPAAPAIAPSGLPLPPGSAAPMLVAQPPAPTGPASAPPGNTPPGTGVGGPLTLPAPAAAAGPAGSGDTKSGDAGAKTGESGATPGSSPASSGTTGGAASGSAAAPAGGSSDAVKFKFKPGDNNLLQMEMSNGLFKFFVGGRLQIDAVWLRAEDEVARPRDVGGIGRVDDATNFRRARFDFGGTFYKNIDFLMEWDFINTFDADRLGRPNVANTPVPTDMWVTFKEVPWVGNVRIGNQKPPIGFEHMISSRFLSFLERSLSFDAFIENQNNGFEFGVSAFDTYLDDHGTWALGVFKNTRNIFGWNVGDGEYDVTGRVTFLPIYENDGEYLVHVGVGVSHRDFDDGFDRVRARMLLRNGPAVLHNIVAEARYRGQSRQQVVPELAIVWGPVTFQAEYFAVCIRDARTPVDPVATTRHGNVYFQGGNAEILYFLTGEHQQYNRKVGAFGRTIPRSPFHAFREPAEGETCVEQGIGAWQVGLRYSWIDLDNEGIHGGTVHDVTVGLNWFLNPYMKWQWNYICEYRNAPNPANDGWIHGFGTRIAFDF